MIEEARRTPGSPSEGSQGAGPKKRVIRRAFRWVFRRRLCFGGLAGALVFLCLSFTPSLLPRAVILQGAVSGITMVIGYGLGSAASAGLRKVVSEPSPRFKRTAWWVLVGAAVVLVPLFLALGRAWQEDVRRLMGMEPAAVWEWGAILVPALVVAALLLVISRVVRGFGRLLVRFIDRFMPRAVSVTAGVAITAVVVVGLIQGFVLDPLVSGLNSSFSLVNEGTEPGIVQPTVPERSGSPASLVPWESLGVKGRDFVGTGPTVEEISRFTGSPAREPIRVYVGIDSADSLEEQVDLAIAELDRTDAWDRDVLAVFTTTGSGWIDAKGADPLEYMHNGDTALVALQYSFLPSWISFLVDDAKASSAGREMVRAVQQRLVDIPEDERPKLLVFGESLGSYGTEAAFDGIHHMISTVDGALLVGPVFKNPIHTTVTEAREPSSPSWRPIFEEGEQVRFVVDPSDLAPPDAASTSPRVVYLQNSSDPVTYWHPNLLWRSPEWLDDRRGPDVSGDMFWLPVITFWQTAADLAFSTGVPAGHGHKYGANAVDAWAAIYPPEGWTGEKLRQLRGIIGHD